MLKLGYVGGLGLMASPAAVHPRAGGPAQVLAVHDRGTPGAQRDASRAAWRAHGAALVGSLEQLVAGTELDGVVVCCGKNGDDLPVIAEVGARLSKTGRGGFVLHMSTVSTDFAVAAAEYCRGLGVSYANYPLTGGPLGAQRGGGDPQGMLILASGDRELFASLTPTLEVLGRPKFFGDRVSAGAETKLIGQHMVFNGCSGMTTAAALHAQGFADGVLGGDQQVDYFEFLNTGAGGSRQWEVALSKGVRDGVWDEGFMVKHAVVDAVYAAKLAMDHGLPRFAVQPMISVALAFSFLLMEHQGVDLATHSVARELLGPRAAAMDGFMADHGAWSDDLAEALDRCVGSLPKEVRATVRLGVTAADFARV